MQIKSSVFMQFLETSKDVKDLEKRTTFTTAPNNRDMAETLAYFRMGTNRSPYLCFSGSIVEVGDVVRLMDYLQSIIDSGVLPETYTRND